MAEIATIARPYADALFQAAGSSGELDAAQAWLDQLAVVAADPQLLQFADSPAATPDQVCELINGLVRAPSTVTANFLRTVIENGRLAALPEIATQVRTLKNARLGASDATVYSAFPMDEAALAGLATTLEKRFGRKLNLRLELEPAPGARVAPDATVGALAHVGAGARIAAGAVVGSLCEVGAGAAVGAGTRLAARVALGEGCRIGARGIVHSGGVIGADGFGFASAGSGDSARWEKIEQLGAVRIGDDVEIGANTCIDRGALDDTVIGDGVKIDNLIQIGHNVHIGAHTAIAGCVAIAGSAHIGKRCMIGGAAGIVGHIEIADDVVITAMTLVSRSIHEPGVYSGSAPMDRAAKWRKNSVRFRQLDELARRLQRLEQKLKD